MKNKLLSAFICIAFFQMVNITKSSAQIQAFNLDANMSEEFAVLYLKMKNEFQITDAKIQIGSSNRNETDTMERRLRTISNQADILNYMNVQGWNMHQSQFNLNTNGELYPYAIMVHIFRRSKRK